MVFGVLNPEKIWHQ